MFLLKVFVMKFALNIISARFYQFYANLFMILVNSQTCLIQPVKGQSNMIVEGRWQVNAGLITIKRNIWYHKQWPSKAGGCLAEVTTNNGLTAI